MKEWLKRLFVPAFSGLLAACMAELAAGMIFAKANALKGETGMLAGIADIMGESDVLWNILFRSAATIPVLYFFYRRDVCSLSCGHGVWNGRRLFGSMLAGAVVSAGSFFIMRTGRPSAYAVQETLFSGKLWLSCTALLWAAPLSEELFFLGIRYQGLRDKLSPLASGFWSAVFFGLYHGNAAQGFYGFLMGLWLAFVMERSRTVAAPFFVHLSANLMVVILRFSLEG